MRSTLTRSIHLYDGNMSSTKAALKAAKAALDAQKYDEAVVQAQLVLASDSQNYFA